MFMLYEKRERNEYEIEFRLRAMLNFGDRSEMFMGFKLSTLKL